jgi:hypothetical protein
VKRLAAVFMVALLSCATVPVTQKEAAEVTDDLLMLSAHPPDPATLVRITMDQCADLPSCAGQCKKALNAAAESTDPAQHTAILASCFPDLKSEHASSGISGDDWILRTFSVYLDSVRRSVPRDRVADFDQARAQLHLTR